MDDPRDPSFGAAREQFLKKYPQTFPDEYYIGPDGRVFTNPVDAVIGSLAWERRSGTGRNCPQSSENFLLPQE